MVKGLPPQVVGEEIAGCIPGGFGGSECPCCKWAVGAAGQMATGGDKQESRGHNSATAAKKYIFSQ